MESIQDSAAKTTAKVSKDSIKTCEKHDKPIVKEFKFPFSETIASSQCQECLDISAEAVIREEEEQKKWKDGARQRDINRRLHNAMLSPRFMEKTLDNYQVKNEGQKKVVSIAKWMINNFDGCTGLILIGSPGTGKNHIASGIINEVISSHNKTAIMTTAMKVVRTIKDSWKNNDLKESEVIDQYTSPDLLVIDEIGIQFGSETERLYISEIINDRYEQLKPTIIMGNMKLAEITEQVGERVIDRFREGGKVVIFDWESHRKIK